MGHLGFELFPKGFTQHRLTWWLNTSTHHNLHHQRAGYNFGLYFNYWDKIMGTNHPDYQEIFDETIDLFANKHFEYEKIFFRLSAYFFSPITTAMHSKK